MLKFTVQNRQPARMVLEGTLAGASVEEARQVWQRFFQETSGRFVVDLTGVSRIDLEGRLLLATMWQKGADLQAVGCYTKAVLEDITGFPGADLKK